MLPCFSPSRRLVAGSASGSVRCVFPRVRDFRPHLPAPGLPRRSLLRPLHGGPVLSRWLSPDCAESGFASLPGRAGVWTSVVHCLRDPGASRMGHGVSPSSPQAVASRASLSPLTPSPWGPEPHRPAPPPASACLALCFSGKFLSSVRSCARQAVNSECQRSVLKGETFRSLFLPTY